MHFLKHMLNHKHDTIKGHNRHHNGQMSQNIQPLMILIGVLAKFHD